MIPSRRRELPGSLVLLLPLAHDDDARTAYVRAGDVVQVMPMHPRHAEHFMDDPPDWW